MGPNDERRPLLPGDSYRQHDRKSRRMRLSVRSRTIAACMAVLVSTVLERMAFYSIVCSLVVFLNNPLQWMSYNAVMALFVFMGLCYTSSLLGGYVADSCLGKFKTILLFLLIYICGYVCMPLLHPYPSRTSASLHPPKWCKARNDTNYSDPVIPWTPIDGDKYRAPHEETCAWLVCLGLVITAVGAGGMKANVSPFGADQV